MSNAHAIAKKSLKSRPKTAVDDFVLPPVIPTKVVNESVNIQALTQILLSLTLAVNIALLIWLLVFVPAEFSAIDLDGITHKLMTSGL